MNEKLKVIYYQKHVKISTTLLKTIEIVDKLLLHLKLGLKRFVIENKGHSRGRHSFQLRKL